ncbi:MAG: EamA family transporter, partial [Bacillota bacterium]|nr:EamA family transporter [Bacillota bacterium]
DRLSFNADSILKLISSPYIISGIILYSLATVIWLYILSKENLSKVYPIQSICYILSVFIGMYFFKESIPLTRWIGVFIIMMGVFFVSLR